MANRKYVYFGMIDRFGYDINCIALTEKECRDAIIKEYIRVYKQENGTDPQKAYNWMKEHEDDENIEEYDEYYEYNEDARYFENFLEELIIAKQKLGKVCWALGGE